MFGRDKNRAFSVRYGARDPLLAPWPRAAVYLAWRAFIAGVRPAVFLALVAGGSWLLLSAFQAASSSVIRSEPLEQQIERAFFSAAPHSDDRRTLWVERVDAALRPPGRNAPDLALAESYLEAAIAIEGRRALALGAYARGRRTASVEADLRGRPAWEQEAILADSLEQLLEAGREAGAEPAALILAPPSLRARVDRARRLYGPAFEDAALWFVARSGRALTLASLPGALPDAAILYGDVRDIVVQACALAQAAGRSIGQCRVGFLPKPRPDPVLAGLSLAVLASDEAGRPGARLIKAAYGAGHLSPRLAEQLAFGPDPELGREALLAAVMPVLSEAGEAWTQPVRYRAQLAQAGQAAAAAARIDNQDRQAVFTAMGAVRREVGAVSALRLAVVLQHPSDADRLAVLAETAGRPLLALADLDRTRLDGLMAGGALERASARASDWPRRAQLQAGAGASMILFALALLLGGVVAGAIQARSGRPGWLERIDGAASRLILGKNF